MRTKMLAVAIIGILFSAGAASAACKSVVVVNGQKFESDKCNSRVVNGKVEFSNTPFKAPTVDISKQIADLLKQLR